MEIPARWAHAAVMAWARANQVTIPARPCGCTCGCTSKRPYLIDPDCTAAWPIREDPACGACGALLDPDGTCFACPPPSPPPVQAFTGRCHACGKPGHYRAQCQEGKR